MHVRRFVLAFLVATFALAMLVVILGPVGAPELVAGLIVVIGIACAAAFTPRSERRR